MKRDDWWLMRSVAVGFAIMFSFYFAVAWALNRAHKSWCADQYAVAATHADTVTAARLCGAP